MTTQKTKAERMQAVLDLALESDAVWETLANAVELAAEVLELDANELEELNDLRWELSAKVLKD